ncbi:MAG: hypothetical protein ABSF33_03485 [Acidimicrobiales bacterium]
MRRTISCARSSSPRRRAAGRSCSRPKVAAERKFSYSRPILVTPSSECQASKDATTGSP